jgi:hypothetical protein
MWEKLEKVNVGNKERYLELFKEIIKKVEVKNYDFKDVEGEDYYIVNEENRKESRFVHIVPKELINLFNEIKDKAPDEFLGFTVLVGDVRVSCFGIPCSELSKAIIN